MKAQYINAIIKGDGVSINTEDSTITKIVFGNKTTYSSMLGNATGVDVTQFSNGKTKLYKVGTVAYILSETNSTIYASDCSYMFYNFKALTEIVFDNLDTSSVTDMSYMFSQCSGFTSINLSGLDTSSVTNMGNMFYGCSGLKIIDISTFNVDSVTSIASMFDSCTALRVIYVAASWNKSLSSSFTFYGCSCLQGFYKDGNDLKSYTFNNSNFTGTYAKIASSSVFGYLTSVAIKSDVTSYMNVSGRLLPGGALNRIINRNTTKVIFGKKQNYTQAISNATAVDVSYKGDGSIKLYSVNNIVYILSETNSTIYATGLGSIFNDLSSLNEVDFTNLNTSSVTDMSRMFYRCKSLTSINLSGLNTSNVTDMSYMFADCTFTSLDLSGFSIPNGTDMECMFSNCSKLNVIYVSSTWNTTSNSGGTFAGCTKLYGFYKNGNNVLYNAYDESCDDSSFACLANSSNGGYLTNVAIKSDVLVKLQELNAALANVLLPGEEFNVMLKGGSADIYTRDTTIAKIVFGNKQDYSSKVSGKTGVDVTQGGQGKIKLYNVGSEVYILHEENSTIYADANCYAMFSDLINLNEIVFDNFNTSRVVDMSYMFVECEALTGIDFSGFNTSNVTSMEGMFGYSPALMGLDLSSFNTSQVTNMSYMFSYCYSLSSLNLSSFNTSNVMSMYEMFAGCAFKSLDLSSFNPSSVEYMENMFVECANLEVIYVNSSWNVDLSSSDTFSSCNNLKGYYLSGNNVVYNEYDDSYTTAEYAKLANSTNHSYLTNIALKSQLPFSIPNGIIDAESFNILLKGADVYSAEDNTITRIVFGNKSSYASAVAGKVGVDISYDFDWSIKLYIVGTERYILSENNTTIYATSCKNMFNNFAALQSVVFDNFNTSRITDMSYMFYNCKRLLTLDLSSFTTSNVTTMSCMFYGCTLLRSVNVSSFNTANVTAINSMFHNCSSLVTLDLSSFSTSNVTDMNNMFYNCSSLKSIDFSNLNFDSVISFISPFDNCTKLTVIYVTPSTLGTLAVAGNTGFSNCSKLVGYYLDGNGALASYSYGGNYYQGVYARVPDSENRGFFTDVSLRPLVE